MASYSFCVRDKKTGEYIRDTRNHELAFLDFFATRFNNQEELMRFLGVDTSLYDDISIGYMSNHELRILPIFFDAPELEAIVREMVTISSLEEYPSIYDAIAVAYNFPKGVQVASRVPECDASGKILLRLQIEDMPTKALKAGLLHQKAHEFITKGYRRVFNDEMNSSYLSVRKAYMAIRNENYINGNHIMKPGSNMTMEELVDRHNSETMSIYQILERVELTPYEERLVTRVLNNDDEEAYEELMASNVERLKYLSPVLAYLSKARGKERK